MAGYIWKGNNVAHFLKLTEDAAPVPVGGKVQLTKEQVDRLRADGHFFDDDKETPDPQAAGVGAAPPADATAPATTAATRL